MTYKIKKVRNFSYKLILLLFLIIFSNQELYDVRYLRWPIIGLVFISIIFLLLTKRQVGNLKFIKWVFVFNFLICLSCLWTINFNFSFMAIKIIAYNSIFIVYLYLLIESEDELYNILRIYLLSAIITSSSFIMRLNLSDILSMRIGAQSLGNAWNANDIARYMAYGSFFSFVLLMKNKTNSKQRSSKIIYAFISTFLAAIVILTGSRQGFMILAISIGVYYISISKKKKFARIVLVLLGVTIIIYLGLNVPQLYGLYGNKIEDTLTIISSRDNISVSDNTRLMMIEAGFNYFKRKPIIGYGVYSFSYLFGLDTGIPNYAHNNYIDILTGLGIVGFIIYYSSYLYVLKKSTRNKNKDQNLLFAFSGVLALLIGDLTVVSYFKLDMLIFLSIIFGAIRVYENKKLLTK